MAWPVDTLTTTHLDQNTDSPLQARSELYAAVQMLKSVLAEVTDGATVWSTANDGAGSGLAADTLDGLHASSFLQTSAIGTTVQAYDVTLHQLALLAPYANYFIVGGGSSWAGYPPATARIALGLGNSATLNVGNTSSTVAPGSGSTVYKGSSPQGYQNLGNLVGPTSCNWAVGTNAGNYKKAHNSSSNNTVTITINNPPGFHGEELFFELSNASSNPIRLASTGLWSNKAATWVDHYSATPSLYRVIRAPTSWPVSVNYLVVSIET